jgi:hypothetical protein
MRQVGTRLIAISVSFVVALGLWPTAAAASIVVLDFESLTASLEPSNYFEDGFRVSPNCHYDTRPAGSGEGYNDSQAIGWDAGGSCFDPDGGLANDNFLGPDDLGQDAVLYIDHDGKPFSLLSMYFGHIVEANVESSKGGVFHGFFPEDEEVPGALVSFSGPEWTGIKWLLFHVGDIGAPISPIDQLTLKVFEPGTLALLSIGLAGVGFARRRQLH